MSARLHIWSIEHLLVCLPADTAAGTVAGVQGALVDRPALDRVLEVLTADGLDATPPFLLAATEPGGTRVVVRGSLSAVAHGRDGTALALDAGLASTWNDDLVSDIVAIAVSHDAGTVTWMPAVAREAAVAAPPAEAEAEGPHTLDEEHFQQFVEAAQDPTAFDLPPVEPPVARRGSGLGERDGRTLAQLGSVRAAALDATSVEPVVRPGGVAAVRCPAGHANPPIATACRVCQHAIVDPTEVVVVRPVVARLRFDSGLVIDVDRPQIIGRHPQAPPDAVDIPNLVTVPSPGEDVSRNHLALRLEGWDLLAEDLESTNGTELRLPNRDVVRLRGYSAVPVVVGAEITLAGDVRFHVDAPDR